MEKKIKVYAIEPTEHEGYKEINPLSNKDFIKRAKQEGTVFTLEQFEKDFNSDNVDTSWFIRFL